MKLEELISPERVREIAENTYCNGDMSRTPVGFGEDCNSIDQHSIRALDPAAIAATVPEPEELAALRRDAERYRWLRESSIGTRLDSKNGKRNENDFQVIRWIGKTEADVLRRNALDEAIDAAIAREKESQNGQNY